MKMELRVNPTSITANEDGTMTVAGYVNRTEQRSNMLGRNQKFTEVIKKGAWQRAINNAKEVHFLAEHDKAKILASTRNNSLELREDDEGLYMTATISPTSWGKDYYTLIKDGILQNMSFGFRAVKDAWRNMGSHFERTVNELELFEVSVVRDPAYASSTISARGIDLVEDEVPDSEKNLRSIEIRNDDDIEAIARKIFEMLQNSTKVAEGHEEKEEVVEEQSKPEDPIVEPEPKKEDTPEKPDDTEEVEEVDEKEKVEDVEDNKEEVKEDPDPEPEEKDEPEEPVQTGADRIRDFINQFK
jgi:HK97 family phage prohead protease